MRGGFGRFANRPMGNAEYGTQYVAPHAYDSVVNAFDALGMAPPGGLTYDTIRAVDPYAQLSGVNGNFQHPNERHFLETRSFSVALSQRLPETR